MIGLIKCHYSYLFSRVTIFILSIFILSIDISLVLIASSSDYETAKENTYFFFENSFMMIKLLTVFFSIYLFTFSFLSKQDNYVILIITSNISRFRYFITKYLAVLSILFLVIYLELISYVIISKIIIKNIIIDSSIIQIFINLLLICLYYSGIALQIGQLTDNIYSSIIPLILFISSTIIDIKDNNFFSVFLPNYNSNSYLLQNGYINIFFLILFIISINLIVFYKKDL